MVTYPHLKVSVHKGELMAAYLYLTEMRAVRYARSKEVRPNYIVDLDSQGELLGLELLDPENVTLEIVNQIMSEYHAPPVTPADLAPLKVA